MTITPPDNRAPVVRGGISDVYGLTVGQSRTVDVASRFSDPDGDSLTYSARSSAPTFVRASISGTTLTITGLQRFTTGAARITVTARDPRGLTAELSFHVRGATGGNRSPVVRGGISDVSSLTVGQSRTVDVASRFSDPDGDSLTYSARSSAPTFVRASISGTTLTITALQRFTTGAARITVTARDPRGLTAELSFDVRGATGGNRAPVVRGGISDVSSLTVGQSRTVDVASRFSDPDGDSLTYSASSSAPTFVRASISGTTLTITALQRFTTGAARITVTARDPRGLTAELSFHVRGATGGNRAPVVRGGISDVSNMTVGQSRTVNVADRFSDPDRDSLTYSARSSAPTFVRASISGTTLTITALQRFTTGTARITVTARDPHGLTAELSFDVRGATALLYGAIARSWNAPGRTCAYSAGIAANYDSRSAARSGAISECRRHGGVNCVLIREFGSAFTGRSLCAASARGESSSTCVYRTGVGNTRAEAESAALSSCRSSGVSNCQLHRTSGGGRWARCTD